LVGGVGKPARARRPAPTRPCFKPKTDRHFGKWHTGKKPGRGGHPRPWLTRRTPREPRVASRGELFLAASSLDGSHDHLHLFPESDTQLMARLRNPGPVLLPALRALALLLVGQVKVLGVRDAMRQPIAYLLLALLLQVLELLLLSCAEDVADLLHLFPDGAPRLLGDGRHLFLLLVRELERFQ